MKTVPSRIKVTRGLRMTIVIKHTIYINSYVFKLQEFYYSKEIDRNECRLKLSDC